MYCRKCGVELKPNALFCKYCGTGIEDFIDDRTAKDEMTSPGLIIPLDLPNASPPLGPVELRGMADWLDASSAWLESYTSITLPIPSEPYDWSPDDDLEEKFPQYIPISPPVWDDQPVQANAAIAPTEKSMLILIDEILPRKFGEEDERAVEIISGKSEEGAAFTYIIENKTDRQRTRVISSVLLLLIAVILLFVFAYIAQN
jgi:hypothetical protein